MPMGVLAAAVLATAAIAADEAGGGAMRGAPGVAVGLLATVTDSATATNLSTIGGIQS